MLHSSLFIAGVGGLALAAPRGPPSPGKRSSDYDGTSLLTVSLTTDACGHIASLSSSYVAASPSATPYVRAELAYECLNSIPFNQTASGLLMDSIEPYLEWQTTLSRVANPPAEYVQYVQGPFDFHQAFAHIRAKVNAGGYDNQYQFAWALFRAFERVHDGHFSFIPLEVIGIISFGRALPLVSVSSDGRSAPRPYLLTDIIRHATAEKTTFSPSPVITIDGIDAIEYLEDWANYGTLQDPDALYNNVFYSPAQFAADPEGNTCGTFAGASSGSLIYPGPNTTLGFENGTFMTTTNYGRLIASFLGVKTGADLYFNFLDVDKLSMTNVFDAASASNTTAAPTTSTAMTSAAASTTVNVPGYPSAIYRHNLNYNSGYFLQGQGYDDIIVIAASSFVVGEYGQVEFQQVIKHTIAAAQSAGKSKLIIDVSANGGGAIDLGYDFFTQLFPHILTYGGSRFRAHEALDLLGEAVSEITAGTPRSPDLNGTVAALAGSSWNFRTDTDINYEPFTSWAEKYGPVHLGPDNDNFTAIMRLNLSDPLVLNQSGGINISGYGPLCNETMTPFAPEDIIIVYDGYCASTCTLFSEMMRNQAGVKAVSLGGRSNTDITQAVGGVKGAVILRYLDIFSYSTGAYSTASEEIQQQWRNSAVAKYNLLSQQRALAPSVNARDAFRQYDTTDVPLQFVYEPADCRILYTPSMILDQSVVWKTVANTVFGKGTGACVAGGIGPHKARSGGEDVRVSLPVSPSWHIYDHDRNMGGIDIQSLPKCLSPIIL
ncbi:hypothetical protein ANO11243_047480 [Dothideomycetidae sp. 11243]|nr:hypothetical protein ANO11243_047480 [fungal sp. No.11243]